MLHDPKIPGSRNAPDSRCVAFEKYDGTNLHWDWDRDFGWHAFGTRRDEFNLTNTGVEQFAVRHAHLRECVDVFQDVLADGLERVFREHPGYTGFPSFKAFTEFLGPNSFAGLHKADEPKELRLFDVWAEPFGMVGPSQFVADFGHLPVARVVYEGRLTGKFAEDVRVGKYGMAGRCRRFHRPCWSIAQFVANFMSSSDLRSQEFLPSYCMGSRGCCNAI